MRNTKLSWVFVALLLLSAPAIAQNTFPVNDVANPREGCYAFINATIYKDANTKLENATMVIRKGKIQTIGEKVAIPAEAIIVDCKGKYLYPSFIDAWSDYGAEAATSPVSGPGGGRSTQMLSGTKGAYGWNQAIRSETNISASFEVNEAKAKELRALGFGTVLTHRMDGISRGTGAVVSLASDKENKVLLKEKASAFYSFSKGSSTQDYPTSLMGSIALLRQNFLDAEWYKGRPASEGVNLSLQAFLDNQTLPQVFESTDKWSDLRADKIGDEFGVQYIIKGGGNEYQRINEIKATKASYILPLAFPEAMDVEDPTDARFVSLASLKHWELAAGNPASFEKANINFALTAYGLKESAVFLSNLRKAIQMGLSEEKAFVALIKAPALLLGVFDQVGSLETGKQANFLIVSGPIFSEHSVVHQNWVQGIRYVLRDQGWNDVRGNYTLVINEQTYLLQLKGDIAKPTAVMVGKDSTKVEIVQNERLIKISFTTRQDSTKTTRLSGVISNSGWMGTGQLANGKWVSWTAVKSSELKTGMDSSGPKKSGASERASLQIIYPFNGYGVAEPPMQQNILITNTTVWTSEQEGKLTNTDVLVKNGKIVAVGKGLKDQTARIIDGTGKHLSAGIIDEHSHIAGTGSINECSQSVTAESRIADIIDPEDVDIYRQLSGGVTSSHILHGSCNTMGGQTQLIKLRWGVNAEQMKFANWDPFIKFALGENVKRSSTQNNPRFPDTRMGVEEVLTDAFTRAMEYQKMGPGKRKDLELEALSEILNKKRFITCHSYVQSEINALIKVADKFGFTVNTFTHILEGYKVADKMKAHGSAASTFSDWWGYKVEVIDAIPQNAAIMQQVGVNVAINSDDAEMARRLNQEAAKSIKYAGMKEEDALKMVTINPAAMLHVSDRTGSIKAGKDADLVLWSDHPLSIYAKAEKTIVDGVIYFDRDTDQLLRDEIGKERTRIIQKMIASKKSGDETGPAVPSFRDRNACEDDHHEGNSLWDRIVERFGSMEAE